MDTVLIATLIMYIWHALINALSTHMIHINLNMIFYTLPAETLEWLSSLPILMQKSFWW